MQEIDIRIQELNKTICENIELIVHQEAWFLKIFYHRQEI